MARKLSTRVTGSRATVHTGPTRGDALYGARGISSGTPYPANLFLRRIYDSFSRDSRSPSLLKAWLHAERISVSVGVFRWSMSLSLCLSHKPIQPRNSEDDPLQNAHARCADSLATMEREHRPKRFHEQNKVARWSYIKSPPCIWNTGQK